MADIEVSVGDGVALVRLNRPQALNALTMPMAEELRAQLASLAAAPAIGALVLAGAGRAFCAGADVRELEARGGQRSQYVAELAALMHESLMVLQSLPFPVLAAVKGPAVGGGFGLVLTCDLVVAGSSSRFAAGYHRVGLTPDGGATYWLPRMVGARRAQEILMGGRTLGADDALQWGLINRVVPDDEVEKVTERWAWDLARGPHMAQRETKRLLATSGQRDHAGQLAAEQEAVTLQAGNAEASEGLRSFLEGRAPNYGPAPG